MLVVPREKMGIWDVLMIIKSQILNQEIDFTIPEKYKTPSVNCSGGADSSILLYMVVKYILDNKLDMKVNVLTCSNHVKDRWNGRKAESVINFISENLSDSIIDTHYVYYRETQATHHFHEVESKLFKDNRTDLIISGITSNPPENTIVTDINGMEVDIYKTALNNRHGNVHKTWHISTENAGDFWTPFVNVDKRFISELYKMYEVETTLLPLTRSCEKKAKGQPFNPSYEHETCGICWWCLERKWAFGSF